MPIIPTPTLKAVHKGESKKVNPTQVMVSKTRELLIEVSRQLFVHKGINNTTMSDIANASDKGRRTVYTYFKNKREIYNAVLERESEILVSELREIVDDPKLLSIEKLQKFMEVRFITSEANQSIYSQLKSFFTRDYKRLDKIRQLAYHKEEELLDKLMILGIKDGSFDKDQAERMAKFWIRLSRSIDMSLMHEENAAAESIHQQRRQLINFILDGIRKR